VLRVLAGLWDTGTGTVWRPNLSRLMFLPQSPYLVLGSLRSQLYYPGNGQEVSATNLEEVLRQTSLSSTVARVGGLDAEMDWPNVLSVGEQQLIGFARLILRRPSFVLLDEATSAIDPDTVKRLYSLMQEFAGTYVSVGPREELEQFHDTVLELNGKSGWKVEFAKQERDERFLKQDRDEQLALS
jgi:putative ATP-binding cassette transporter